MEERESRAGRTTMQGHTHGSTSLGPHPFPSFFVIRDPSILYLFFVVRFKQVMGLLKRIKQFVVGDPSHYGHEIGSVGDIDDQYGLDNLTLDMKLLFKPYNSQVHSAVASVQTSAL